MKMSGARIVVEQLCAHGVDTVFGYPGGAVLPLYDELYKNAHRVRHIITAHEQGAAHAADGYARVSGKTGVVIATSGPGATNLVTGIANAYLDSVPLVAITGNAAAPLLGKDSFQEVDIVGITQPVVKHSFIVRDVRALERTLAEAFHIADSGRRGPVLVDIPKNVQEESCEYVGPASEPYAARTNGGCRADAPERNPDMASDYDPERELTTSDCGLTRMLTAIRGCERPYIYAGGGVLAGGAENELRALSERLSAPVGFSMMGLTALPDDYALNLGMCGMHGRYAATVAQSECDLMIALGVRFSDRATGNAEAFRQGRVIIHVDIDLAEIGKNVSSHINVCADVKQALSRLLAALPPMRNEKWLARIAELKRVGEDANNSGEDGGDGLTPREIIQTVSLCCDADTPVATDVGQHQMWVAQHYPFRRPRTFLTSGGLGTMGYGMGAAIGACVAHGGRRTVLFTGDGSFGMNLTELATAVSQALPLVVVVLNNGVLGMVRQWQGMFFGERYSQTTLNRRTDFVALAKAFGAEGYAAETLPELEAILGNLTGAGPTVIDCRVGMDEKVLPMIPPGGTVKNIVIR